MKVSVYCASKETLPEPSARFESVEWTFDRPDTAFYLEYYDDKIVLQKHAGPEHPLFVDFSDQWREFQKQRLSAKTDLLGRACAAAQGRKIFDLTMGLGSDSLKLVYFGAEVMAMDKQVFMYELVRDAVYRIERDFTFDNGNKLLLDPHFGDSLVRAKEYVAAFEVFYLDPMFHLHNRTALPKKKMQFLNEIIGENSDEEFLPTVRFLLDHKKRVVVKRHPDAPVFGGLKPKSVYEGKKIRFEVF